MDEKSQILYNSSIDLASLAERTASLEEKVAFLIERQKIVDVYRRYTRGLNRFDMELLNSAFWPDAQINYGSSSYRRDDWIADWTKNRYSKGFACQAHHIVNESVDISGNDAHVETYLIALWRPPSDDQAARILAGRYIDRLLRRAGDWRIHVREYVPHFWAEATSVFFSTYKTNWPLTDGSLGATDRTDFSYHRPLHPRPRGAPRSDTCD